MAIILFGFVINKKKKKVKRGLKSHVGCKGVGLWLSDRSQEINFVDRDLL